MRTLAYIMDELPALRSLSPAHRETLAGCARSEVVTSQAAYWRSVLDPEGGGIPKDGASERCFQDRQTASFSLAEDATRALLAAAPERPARLKLRSVSCPTTRTVSAASNRSAIRLIDRRISSQSSRTAP